MAKINTDNIENFDSMTAEEKLNAILQMEFEPPKADETEITKYKNLLSKANSEAAGYKKKWQETLSESEKAAQIQKDADEAKDNLIKQLQRDKAISEYRASYIALGYDAESAQKASEAMADNDVATIFALQKLHNEAVKKSAESSLLDNLPKPSPGKSVDKDKIDDELWAKIRKSAGL